MYHQPKFDLNMKLNKREFALDMLIHLGAFNKFVRNITLYYKRRDIRIEQHEIAERITDLNSAFIWSDTLEGQIYWKTLHVMINTMWSMLALKYDRLDLIEECIDISIYAIKDELGEDEQRANNPIFERIRKYGHDRFIQLYIEQNNLNLECEHENK